MRSLRSRGLRIAFQPWGCCVLIGRGAESAASEDPEQFGKFESLRGIRGQGHSFPQRSWKFSRSMMSWSSAFSTFQLQELRTPWRTESVLYSDLPLSCLFLLPAVVTLLHCPAMTNQHRYPMSPSQLQVPGVGRGQTAVNTPQGLGCLCRELQSEAGPSAHPSAALLGHQGGLSPEGHGLGHGGSLQLSRTLKGLRAGGCLLSPLPGASKSGQQVRP